MILIALGANLPGPDGQSPEQTLEGAKRALEARGVRILASSRTFLTRPVPASSQPWYRNAVIAVETEMAASALLQTLQAVELDFGRVRGARNAARVLDLDLIAYDQQVISKHGMEIPHPRMHERGFVLHPLQEVAPEWRHPVSGLSVRKMLAKLASPSVDKTGDSEAA